MEPRSNAWVKQGVNKSRSSHTIGNRGQFRVGDWVSKNVEKRGHSGNKVDVTRNMHNVRSNPNLADEGIGTHITREKSNSHSERVQIEQSAWNKDQNRIPKLEKKNNSVDDIIDWIEVDSYDEIDGRQDTESKTKEFKHTEEPQKAVSRAFTNPRDNINKPKIRGWPRPIKQSTNEPLKRTNVSVLREVLGCDQPRWMRLNTDQIRCNQASVMSHRDPMNRISIPTRGETMDMREVKLNPKAHCFRPSYGKHNPIECMTMTAEIDNLDIKGTEIEEGIQQSVTKGEPKEAEQPQWYGT
jgi:hypothetical protein